MYNYIQGIIQHLTHEMVVIDVGGIGYEIVLPGSSIKKMPALGEQVKVYTYFYIREDVHKLYGFEDFSERELFKVLLNVNQIGPKVALAVVAHCSIHDIIKAARTSDITVFKGISGVGPKTAQRLVIELKGKLDSLLLLGGENQKELQVQKVDTKGITHNTTVRSELFAALLSLGYTEYQIHPALKRVEEIIHEEASIEEWIKMVLRVI